CAPLRPGPDAPAVWRASAARTKAHRLARAAPRRARGVRAARCGAVGRARTHRAPRVRRDRAQARPEYDGAADAAGAADRPLRLAGPLEQGGRGAALPLAADDRLAPQERLREALDHLAHAARANPARRRNGTGGRLRRPPAGEEEAVAQAAFPMSSASA